MCSRTCDKCGSKNHIVMPGITGTSWLCDSCPRILEFQYDVDACPTSITDYSEAEKYAKDRSYVNCPEIDD